MLGKRQIGRRYWRIMCLVLAIVALLLAGSANAVMAAAQPTLAVSPSSASAGSTVAVSGNSFPKHASVALSWDGSTSGMPTVSTSANGSFRVSLSIPSNAANGSHVLTASTGGVSVSATVNVVAATSVSTSGYLFGSLLTDQSRATQEYAAGVRVVELELGWDDYEPQDGVFDSSYTTWAQQKLQAFRAAGMKVVLGVGLQYPPSWVFTYPNSRYVNQFGNSSAEVNLTFNQNLRQKAKQYIARVAQDLGPSNFWAVRIGSGGLIESLYPDEWDGTNWHSYWAYDAAAQSGTGLPTSLKPSPFPGWRPGQTQYTGASFSPNQVQQWYDWYLGAMVDGINWQLGVYKGLGFDGYLQVLMPGLGSRPDEYSTAINNYLNGAGDTNGTMGRAAVWNRVVDGLNTRSNVVVYVTSMADGSGNTVNNLCQATDSNVSITDPAIDNWSSTRWISYNANRYGMLKDGENPGRGTTGYGLSMMQMAAQQMQACGFQGFLWAHDADLYDSTSGVTLSSYSTLIAQYP